MKKELNIEKYCIKSDWARPALEGVYHDAVRGYRVANDTKIMVALKSDIPEHLAGRTTPVKRVRKKGIDFINGRYPAWYTVVPPLVNTTGYIKWDVDIHALVPDIKAALKIQKGLPKRRRKNVLVEYKKPGGQPVYLAPRLVLLFADFLLAYPDHKIFTRDSSYGSIYAETPAKDYCLMMPFYVDNPGSGCEVIGH